MNMTHLQWVTNRRAAKQLGRDELLLRDLSLLLGLLVPLVVGGRGATAVATARLYACVLDDLVPKMGSKRMF